MRCCVFNLSSSPLPDEERTRVLVLEREGYDDDHQKFRNGILDVVPGGFACVTNDETRQQLRGRPW